MQSQFDVLLRRTITRFAFARETAAHNDEVMRNCLADAQEQVYELTGRLADARAALATERNRAVVANAEMREHEQLAAESDDVRTLSIELATLWAAIDGRLPRTVLTRLAAHGRARSNYRLRMPDTQDDPTLAESLPSAIDDWVAVVRELDTEEYNDALEWARTGHQDARLMTMDLRLGAMSSDRRVFRTAITATGTSRPRPTQPAGTMKLYITVNGLKALALLDTGSTINAISPDFARVAGVKPFTLDDPIGLQLGCAGSRSKINFGAVVSCKLGEYQCNMYADMVHLDHYDIVLGGPFCVSEKVILDYPAWLVRYNGTMSIAPLEGEDQPTRNMRKTTTKVPKRIAGADTSATSNRATSGSTVRRNGNSTQ